MTHIKTVCLTLGPYRNLTTLTASVLFLHPNCQVLNHAGDRIFNNSDVNFLSAYSKERFNNFIRYATKISGGGKRGDYGGSVTLAHAFDSHYILGELFKKTGQHLIKKQIDCLFWKESLKTSNFIKEYRVDLGYIFNNEERLRFLMPIRNPMDCAKSNLRTGHANRFISITKSTTANEVLLAVLNEIHWFAKNKELFPDRFFYYFEHSISRDMLKELADFLKLDKNEEWLNNAEIALVSKSKYEHDKDFIEFYKENVKEIFHEMPDFKDRLLQFVSNR